MRPHPIYIIPGTTPSISFYLPFDFELVDELWFTATQRNREMFTKCKDDVQVEGSKIIIDLTQEETLMLSPGQKVKLQVRILTTGGDALASQTETVDVMDVQKGGVID